MVGLLLVSREGLHMVASRFAHMVCEVCNFDVFVVFNYFELLSFSHGLSILLWIPKKKLLVCMWALGLADLLMIGFAMFLGLLSLVS